MAPPMAQERSNLKGSSSPLTQLLRRLNDPRDGRAMLLVSLGLLALEAVLCSAIVWKVPCESELFPLAWFLKPDT